MADIKPAPRLRRATAALAMAVIMAPALAGANTYDCGGSNMASFVVSVAESVCTIDADSAVAAELSPLECHYEPPAMKVFKLAGDMTFTITNEGLQTAAGTCALRQ